MKLSTEPPSPPDNGEPATDAQRQFAQLHHARANVLEYLAVVEPRPRRVERLQAAEQSHRQASTLDTKNPQYLAGVARALRKQSLVAKTEPRKAEILDQAEKLLADAIALDAENPGAYNELGETYLAQARVADSRLAFENAIKYGKQAGRKHGLYIYYCNLANACTRDAADQDAFRKALDAAEQAIALMSDAPLEAHYYRGFALWKLRRSSEALKEFAEGVKLDPRHVETLLARSQMVFEMTEPNPPSDTLLKQAYADVREVIGYPDLTLDEQAKAYYVNSLGWLKSHVKEKSEDAMVKCLEFALKGARGSSAYLPFAKQVFTYAVGITWRDRKLQQEFGRLQQEFRAVIEANGAQGAGE